VQERGPQTPRSVGWHTYTVPAVDEPRDLVERLTSQTGLPPGEDERFSGYGVMACPFSSGHILCHRRFVASSIGPAYTSVWHYDPEGSWTFYQDAPPRQACTRFFGTSVDAAVEASIQTDWAGPRRLRVVVEDVLNWEFDLAPTAATRAMNAVGKIMPDALWRNSTALKAMATVAGLALGAGKLALTGKSPNRQSFIANPLVIWTIPTSRAVLRGHQLGLVQAIRLQQRLGDFWIPRTGLFAIGRTFFEPFDEERHLTAVQVGP
jgi:hypothetical protein